MSVSIKVIILVYNFQTTKLFHDCCIWIMAVTILSYLFITW